MVGDGPVLLCGLGKVGWQVLDALKAAGLPVAAADLYTKPDDPRVAGLRYTQGDLRSVEVLKAAGVESARGVVIVTSDDLVNVSTALLIRRLNPDCRIVVRMFNQSLIPRLGAAVRNTVALSVSGLTAPLLVLSALTGEPLAAFKVGDVPQEVVELAVAEGDAVAGLDAGRRGGQAPLPRPRHPPGSAAGARRPAGGVRPAGRVGTAGRRRVGGRRGAVGRPAAAAGPHRPRVAGRHRLAGAGRRGRAVRHRPGQHPGVPLRPRHRLGRRLLPDGECDRHRGRPARREAHRAGEGLPRRAEAARGGIAGRASRPCSRSTSSAPGSAGRSRSAASRTAGTWWCAASATSGSGASRSWCGSAGRWSPWRR